MKKVSEYDLRRLIWGRYLHFIKKIPILESGSTPYDVIKIDVDSIHIDVYDKGKFDSEGSQKEFIQMFAKHIEEITFGNLKVIDSGCKIDGDSYFTWVYIANAYELKQ